MKTCIAAARTLTPTHLDSLCHASSNCLFSMLPPLPPLPLRGKPWPPNTPSLNRTCALNFYTPAPPPPRAPLIRSVRLCDKSCRYMPETAAEVYQREHHRSAAAGLAKQGRTHHAPLLHYNIMLITVVINMSVINNCYQ